MNTSERKLVINLFRYTRSRQGLELERGEWMNE